jgi:UTP:GlnB (protein PII) uridylyltransferase
LRYYGSAYLRRYLQTALKKYPDCLYLLDEMDALAEKSQGILAEAAIVPTPAAKKELLGNYYDLELLRIGLMTLNGAPIEETNAQYTEFSDDYLNYLFDACREELAEEYGRWVTSFDLMAIYAAGGHAREWAFNDDYDLIVLIDTEDEKLQELGGAVISAMNAEICKRGMMPHYRFLEHFGSYVIPVSQLEAFFRRENQTDFIEKSQLLESRLVVGTSTFEEDTHERIIKPFIFARADDYVADMKAEMASRQKAVGDVFLPNNVKECVGGLRDIVMAILICKARFGIRDPITSHILDAIGRVYPQAGLELRSLYNSMCFLKNLRDVYRLTVCLDDNLDFEHADVVGEILGFEGEAPGERGRQVKDAFERTTAKVAEEIESVLAKVT